MKDEDGKILSLFSLILQKNSHGNQDILNLYRDIDDLDTFLKILGRFSGRTVKFPTIREVEDAMTLAFAYYYHEEQGMSWSEVRKAIPNDVSPISYNARINALNKYIRKAMADVIRKE